MQEPIVFRRSVRENILYGNLTAAEIELIEAANNSGLVEYFSDPTNGNKSALKVSVGEKQRIGIARGLLKKAKIFFLDEPTSSLDSENEKKVIDNIIKFVKAKGMTCLMVAHRLNTVEFCDVIYFLENGEIAEFGTHNELIEMKGKYFQFLNN